MRKYAECRGYELVTIFYDGDGGASNGFSALLARLEATGDRDVIVPDLDLIHTHRMLRQTRIDLLQDGVHANLHCSGG